MSFISKQLILWHKLYGRHKLPWQQTNNPYAIWISEIMLQQTQVSTVIDYYKKFMQRFPSIESLANAEIDDVNELWSGLGYYSRARNIHTTAKIILQEYNGIFPQKFEKILEFPGIGRTTAGAICSFAYGKNYPILDGNVKRVFTRFYGIKEWSGKSKVEKELWEIADMNLPTLDIEIYNQALMDLGASVCSRGIPQCSKCPLSESCKSFLNDWTKIIPAPKPKRLIPVKEGNIIIIQNDDSILLVKRNLKQIWGGLWSLPEIESHDDLNVWLFNLLGITKYKLIDSGRCHANFSHYKYVMHYKHILFNKLNLKPIENYIWINRSNVGKIGLPAPIKKLLSTL
ncbi:A/G-specific adenine glycosylase [Methylophilaceae bacterium]|jgi:A/G-specific adenine glycosylase|nr:A/G-specific adenine glycosylase [Methylophilaceae bacterium]